MRTMVLLAAIPLAVYAAYPRAAVSPREETPYVRQVTVEGVRRVAMDTSTFNARWRGVYAMPPLVTATVIPPPLPVPRPRDEAPAVERTPHRVHPRARQTDNGICARHGMKKTFYGKYRWRCRR